jgi:hypothetical protein
MDKVQKPGNSGRYAPSSEPFKNNIVAKTKEAEPDRILSGRLGLKRGCFAVVVVVDDDFRPLIIYLLLCIHALCCEGTNILCDSVFTNVKHDFILDAAEILPNLCIY